MLRRSLHDENVVSVSRATLMLLEKCTQRRHVARVVLINNCLPLGPRGVFLSQGRSSDLHGRRTH